MRPSKQLKQWVHVIQRSVWVLVAATAVCLPVQADTLRGNVVGVSDGDTITVLDASERTHKVRLSGIDAPEKDQPFGQKSKENLSHLVYRKNVRVEWDKTDKYDRLVGKVWVQPPQCPACAMTLDANKAQLSAGLAWWFTRYAKEQPQADQKAYEQEEHLARSQKLGLWSEPTAMAPWDWRAQKKHR